MVQGARGGVTPQARTGLLVPPGWRGMQGRGRALGCGEVKFTGQVRPEARKLTYHIHMKRVILRRLVMGIADATLEVDGRTIYTGKDLRVGLFTSTDGF